MSNLVRDSLDMRNAYAQARKTMIDAGGAGAKLRLYTLPKPADANTLLSSQVLLAELRFSYPCGVVTNGKLVLSTITSDPSANADGDIEFARLLDSNDNVICDMDVSESSVSGAIKFNSVTVVAGVEVKVISGEFIEP
jgi:hypothetical protein